MNKKIEELAKEAGLDWALKRESLTGQSDDRECIEKFAELIIKLEEQYHNKSTNQNILSEDDIWDIQDYFSKNPFDIYKNI